MLFRTLRHHPAVQGAFACAPLLACSVYDESLIVPREPDVGGSSGVDASVDASADAAGGGAGDAGNDAGLDTGAGGAADHPIVGSEAAQALDFELVDDFEDGNKALPFVSGRRGDWFVGPDTGTTVTPNPFLPTTLDLGLRHAPESNYTAYLAAEQTRGWGFVFGAHLTWSTRGYDGSAYCGVRFYARTEPESLSVVLYFENIAPEGVTSTPSYGSVIGLTPDWRDYRVLFSELSKRDTETDFDVTKLARVIWNAPSRGSYELYVDDVYLLLKPEGGTCP